MPACEMVGYQSILASATPTVAVAFYVQRAILNQGGIQCQSGAIPNRGKWKGHHTPLNTGHHNIPLHTLDSLLLTLSSASNSHLLLFPFHVLLPRALAISECGGLPRSLTRMLPPNLWMFSTSQVAVINLAPTND